MEKAEQLQDAGNLGVESRDVPELLPLSYAQESFVGYYDRLDDPCVQHLSVTTVLIGKLDVSALQASVDALVARHAALRMRYLRSEQTLHAVIEPSVTVPVEVLELERDTDQLTNEAFAAFLRRRFDLDAGPLLRLGLIRRAPDKHVLALVVHHSVCDGWSIDLLCTDLAALYASFMTRRPAGLARPAVEYASYVRWLRGWVDSAAGREQLEYWKRKIAGISSPYWLPADRDATARENPADLTFDGAISRDSATRLRKLSEREQTTLFVTATAALAAVLARWSGRGDVLISVVHGGRLRADLYDVVGCFAEAWVLRADLEGAREFLEVLHRVSRAYRDALPHIQVPYWKVKEELTRASVEQPVLDINVTYVPKSGGWPAPKAGAQGTAQAMRVQNVDLRPRDVTLHESTGSKLFVTFIEGSDGSLQWTIEYATHLFGANTIAGVSHAIAALLGNAAADSRCTVAGLRPQNFQASA